MNAGVIVTRKVKHLATYMDRAEEQWAGDWHPICREPAPDANRYGGTTWLHFSDIGTATDPDTLRSNWYRAWLKRDGIARNRPWCKDCRKVLASLNELVGGAS